MFMLMISNEPRTKKNGDVWKLMSAPHNALRDDGSDDDSKHELAGQPIYLNNFMHPN